MNDYRDLMRQLTGVRDMTHEALRNASLAGDLAKEALRTKSISDTSVQEALRAITGTADVVREALRATTGASEVVQDALRQTSGMSEMVREALRATSPLDEAMKARLLTGLGYDPKLFNGDLLQTLGIDLASIPDLIKQTQFLTVQDIAEMQAEAEQQVENPQGRTKEVGKLIFQLLIIPLIQAWVRENGPDHADKLIEWLMSLFQ